MPSSPMLSPSRAGGSGLDVKPHPIVANREYQVSNFLTDYHGYPSRTCACRTTLVNASWTTRKLVVSSSAGIRS